MFPFGKAPVGLEAKALFMPAEVGIYKPGIGRQTELFTLLQQFFYYGSGGAEHRMVGLGCLHEECPPALLFKHRQSLHGALVGPEVTLGEQRIGLEHRHHCVGPQVGEASLLQCKDINLPVGHQSAYFLLEFVGLLPSADKGHRALGTGSGLEELARDSSHHSAFAPLGAYVHKCHRRRLRRSVLLQVLAGHCVVKRLQRRPRAAEHHLGTVDASKHNCGVTRIVAGRGFGLLV